MSQRPQRTKVPPMKYNDYTQLSSSSEDNVASTIPQPKMTMSDNLAPLKSALIVVRDDLEYNEMSCSLPVPQTTSIYPMSQSFLTNSPPQDLRGTTVSLFPQNQPIDKVELYQLEVQRKEQAEVDRQNEERRQQGEVEQLEAQRHRQIEQDRLDAERRQQAEMQQLEAQKKFQAEVDRQNKERRQQVEVEQLEAQRHRQTEQDRLDAERRQQAEMQQLEAQKKLQAEVHRQNEERRQQVEAEQFESQRRRQAEQDRLDAERRQQAEMQQLEAQKKLQAEVDRQNEERRQQIEAEQFEPEGRPVDDENRHGQFPRQNHNHIEDVNMGAWVHRNPAYGHAFGAREDRRFVAPSLNDAMIVQLLQVIRDEQREHHQNCMNEIRKLERTVAKVTNSMLRENEFPTIPDSLPMRTREDIENFENVDDEEYKKVVAYLADLGGYNLNETANLIIKHAIQDAMSPS